MKSRVEVPQAGTDVLIAVQYFFLINCFSAYSVPLVNFQSSEMVGFNSFVSYLYYFCGGVGSLRSSFHHFRSQFSTP